MCASVVFEMRCCLGVFEISLKLTIFRVLMV